MANEVHNTKLAITSLIFNKCKWNNIIVLFGHLEIKANDFPAG